MAKHFESPAEIPDIVTTIGGRLPPESELYIVGGWVRDRLLGLESTEIDLGSIYDIGERFGTVGVRHGSATVEVTTFRSDEYSPGSRHPEVVPVSDIKEDLSRRDFTINAMALSVAPDAGRLLDPFDGRKDIQARLIRTPGDPVPRMAEDPLRMMRAVRFSAQLGFEIEPGLRRALESESGLLEGISWERRRDELEKILLTPKPDTGIRALVDTGLMEHVSPEVARMKGVRQPPAYHRADVLEHTLLTVTYLPADALLRRAALFHDLGKPVTMVTEPKTMFPEHDKVGEELTRLAMRRLRYGSDDIRKTAFLVRRHMRPIRYETQWSDAAVRRLIRDCTLMKDELVVVPHTAVLDLARADIKAGNEEKVPQFLALIDELQERIDAVRADLEVEKVRSPLDGRELMGLFGRGPGPWVGEVKEHLLHLVLEGLLAPGDKTTAADCARDFLDL
jgi:poly(A) polymerase